MAPGSNKLRLAQRHLGKVQAAWSEPTDWDDLSLYGFYCITDLLRDLNDARKATAYGDVALPELDAEDIAVDIERYVAL